MNALSTENLCVRPGLKPLVRFLRFAVGKARRFGLVHFRKRYVARQRAQRAGACGRCGRCCGLAFACPLYSASGRCLTYSVGRPRACVAFPIDERDLADIAITGGRCGYRFGGSSPGSAAPRASGEERSEYGGGTRKRRL